MELSNPRRIVAPTITEMMHRAIREHMDCPNPDAVLNIETHLFNVVLEAESAVYDIDIGKEVWLNKGRWSRLIKEYLSRDSWLRFRDQCVEILTGTARAGATANMLFRDPDRFEKKHRWGGCLMGAVFRGDNKRAGPATLTFYSRTTYIGYMGLLDSAIAAVMAQEIQKAYMATTMLADPVTPNIRFHWHIASSQLHCFKTLPFIYSQPDLIKRLEKLSRNRGLIDNRNPSVPPTWYHVAKWYFKVIDGFRLFGARFADKNGIVPDEHKAQVCADMLAAEKYGPFKRIKRRWLEHQRHMTKLIPPSLKVPDLDFDKAI